jgi:hypothetical protein
MKNNKITAYEIEWDIYEGYLEGLDDDQIRTQYPNEVEIDLGHITTDDPDEIGDLIEQFLEDDYVCVKSFLYDLN